MQNDCSPQSDSAAGRKTQHIDFLDYFRGIAIIGVFLFHLLGPVCGFGQLPWGTWFSKFQAPTAFWCLLPFSFGWAGVAIFFVVSGFCIHLSFTRRPDWSEYVVRRIFRIYPAYVFAIVVCALVIPWSRLHFSFEGAAQLGSHLMLIHNFHNGTFFGINVAFWSIAVEAQLYLLYPLLLLLVSRFGWRRALIYAAAFEIGLRCLASAILMSGNAIPYWLTGVPLMFWFSWSIGAMIADDFIAGLPMPFAKQSTLLWLGIAIGSTFVKPLAMFSFMFFSIATAVLISKLLAQQRISLRVPAFISNHIRKVGVWSYSIYLLHALVFNPACTHALSNYLAAKFHLNRVPLSVVNLAVGLCFWPVIVGISALSHRFIELPGIAVGQRLIKAMRQRTAAKIAAQGQAPVAPPSELGPPLGEPPR